jgi:hypothetical protein
MRGVTKIGGRNLRDETAFMLSRDFACLGIGITLAETIISEARKIGYNKWMCLDTVVSMREAQLIYQSASKM